MRGSPLLLALLLLTPLAGLVLGAPPAPLGPALDCDPACNVRVSAGAAPVSRPAFAIDPTDPLHLIAAANDYGLAGMDPCSVSPVWVSAFESRDGGATWARQPVPGFPGDDPGAFTALAPFACSNAPSVAFDRKGRALVAGRGFTEDSLVSLGTLQNGVWVAQRLHGEWVGLGLVTAAATFYMVHEQPTVAVDPNDGVAYVGWSASGIPVMARSLDGTAWGAPVLPVRMEGGVPSVPPLYFGQGVRMAIGSRAEPPANDLSHDLFFSFSDGLDIWEALSIDHGGGWEHVEHVASVVLGADGAAPEHGIEMVPSMVSYFPKPNPQNVQTLYLAWADARFGASDVVVTRDSDNGHAPFDFVVRVSDDTNGAQQFGPAIAAGPDGAVHAAWYDDRHVPDTGLTHVYYSVSRDGGLTWSPNLRVTQQGFDPYVSEDHLGRWDLGQVAIAVDPQGVAHVLWTDTRHGHAQVYAARVLP